VRVKALAVLNVTRGRSRQEVAEIVCTHRQSVGICSDEASFYRQPSQAWLGASLGRAQPRLPYSHRANTLMRLVGFLDAVSGRVQAWDFNRVTASRLGQCWLRAAQSYPQAKTIYLVIDNWPVHFHPKRWKP
jgi:hypothetical protein